jgi:hypothetical protein
MVTTPWKWGFMGRLYRALIFSTTACSQGFVFARVPDGNHDVGRPDDDSLLNASAVGDDEVHVVAG